MIHSEIKREQLSNKRTVSGTCWDYLKRSHIFVSLEYPEEEEKQLAIRKLFEEIIAETS